MTDPTVHIETLQRFGLLDRLQSMEVDADRVSFTLAPKVTPLELEPGKGRDREQDVEEVMYASSM